MAERFGRYINKAVAPLLLVCLAGLLPVATSAQTSDDLPSRVGKLEQTLNNRGLLDLLQEIEDLKRDMAKLRGQLEEQAYALEQLKKGQPAGTLSGGRSRAAATVAGDGAPLPVLQAVPQQAVAGTPATQGDLQVQLNHPPAIGPDGLSTGGGATPVMSAPQAVEMPPGAPPAQGSSLPAPGDGPPPTMEAAGSVVAGSPRTTSDDTGSETAYRDAFTLLKSGEYEQAISAFSAFQQHYPTSQYGDNAQFWLAEAHYVRRDFPAALGAYQQMLSNYPTSKKLSHAMLKIGYCYAELGKTIEAKAALTDLQQRFPGSAAAQLAAQRIAQLPASR